MKLHQTKEGPRRRSFVWRPGRGLGAKTGLFLLIAAALPASADVRLPAILSAHAVLQRSPQTVIWGWAEPGEKVAVSLDESPAHTVAGPDGRWKTVLDLTSTRQGPLELVVEGKNRLTVPDVLIGDVWLASGQSNMQFTLNATTGGVQEIARSANPLLRWFAGEHKPGYLESQEEVAGRWVIAAPGISGDCSGVAYYFGKKIQADLKVPVGLVLTAVGGTTIQSWMSKEVLEGDKELNPALNSAGKGTKPRKNPPPQQIASFFFNQLIHPLARMRLRGVIWYHGESHFSQGPFYRRAFPALIRDWRRALGDADLPFYFCQLSNVDRKTPNPAMAGWVAEVREAQDAALQEPHTGEAVLIDAGGIDFHPLNKEIVGHRLAVLAEAGTYGLPVEAESPRFEAMTVEAGQIRLQFRGMAGGLVARALPKGESPNEPESEVQGFAICGSDRKWVWARAAIEGEAVKVWSPKILAPIAVRYAWANNPTCNLYNKAGFPAAPFRTDDQ